MPGRLSRLWRRKRMLPLLVVSVFLTVGGSVALAVAPAPTAGPQNTAPPVIKGKFQEGSPIHATTGSWTTTAGPLTYVYGFYLCNSKHPYPNCALLVKQVSPTYFLKGGAVGGTIVVSVTATDQNHASSTVHSAQYPTGGTVLPLAPRNIEHPTIGGTARDGSPLRVRHGYWHSPDPLTYKYKWEACGASGSSCSPIPGATAMTFKLTHKYVGQFVTALVTATDVNMPAPYQKANTGQATAPQRGPVKPPPPPRNISRPTITGTPTVGQVLHAKKGTWTSIDLAYLKYTYQWERCTGAGKTFTCVAVHAATRSTYKLTTADRGDMIAVVVTATDPEHQHKSATAAPIGPVS